MDTFFAQGFGILFVLCLLSLLIDKFSPVSTKSAAHTGTAAPSFNTQGETGERK